MGNHCTPVREVVNGTNITETETKQALEDAEPSEKLVKIIDSYKEANEGMKKALEEVKRKGEQDQIAQREATIQNEKIMEELNAMKAMLAKKEQALLKHQLEAALHSKANYMVNSDSVAKLLKTGILEKFTRRKVKNSKEKWVELELHNCQNTQNGFRPGYMLLTYADKKDSKISHRCHVDSVDREGASIGDKFRGRNFLVRGVVGGVKKELIFTSTDERVRNDWVDAFTHGFTQIEDEKRDMNKPFFLNVEFTKEKLGIFVVEVLMESKEEYPEEKQKIAVRNEESKTAAKEAQLADDAKQAHATDTKQSVENESMDPPGPSSDEDGGPCELLVKEITDNDLFKRGLVERCVISAINGKRIRGMSYDKQVWYITKTKRPYTLTFTGPKYLKKKAVQTTTYPGILKKLVADGENDVKSAFNDLIRGTTFRKELESTDDKASLIGELLSNQRRLTAVLQNVGVQEMQL